MIIFPYDLCRTQAWDYFRDEKVEGNTGFYYVRNTFASKKIWLEFFQATDSKIFK